MNVLDSILDVFDAVSTWIQTAVSSVMPMFYSTTDGLTFLGVLAVAGLAFSVVFLIKFWSLHIVRYVEKLGVKARTLKCQLE